MHEYWHSSLLACEKYLNSPNITFSQKLYQKVPDTFKEIRPWVKYGWEMVLIVHEIIKSDNQLGICLLYTSPSPRDGLLSRMPSSA